MVSSGRVISFTDARVRALPLGSGIWRDAQVKGLLVICHARCRTFAVQGDVRRNRRHVRTVRLKIDRCDRIGIREARIRAKELMSSIQSGVDPTKERREGGVTLLEAYKAHCGDRALRPTTAESYELYFNQYLSPLKNRLVRDISRQDVRDLFDELKRKRGLTTAANAMRLMRAVVNTAIRIDETVTRSPMIAIRIPMPGRRRVPPLDVRDWWERTERLQPQRRDLQRVMLLTGARKTSVLTLKREDVDLENGILTFRHMKTGGELMYPMGRRLTEILRRRMEEDEPLNSVWLWPSSKSACGHATEGKQYKDDLPSPHALRHINRTLAIAAHVPYAESALLLGQRLPGASGGYVHPEHLVEHLRPYAQAIEDRVLALALAPPNDVAALAINHRATSREGECAA